MLKKWIVEDRILQNDIVPINRLRDSVPGTVKPIFTSFCSTPIVRLNHWKHFRCKFGYWFARDRFGEKWRYQPPVDVVPVIRWEESRKSTARVYRFYALIGRETHRHTRFSSLLENTDTTTAHVASYASAGTILNIYTPCSPIIVSYLMRFISHGITVLFRLQRFNDFYILLHYTILFGTIQLV